MEIFFWNMAISFQLLFIIVSSVIFVYISSRSFKYYALYNIFLLIYLISRSDFYYDQVEKTVLSWIGETRTPVVMEVLNFYIQIIFYTCYSFFAFYFLDFNKIARSFFRVGSTVLNSLTLFFLVLGLVCIIINLPDVYFQFYTFLYIPVMITLFLFTVAKGINNSGNHKYLFLIGVCFYVLFAVAAFVGSIVDSLEVVNPIKFFYVGIILETIFFSLGLAYKIKMMNDEKNRVQRLVILHRHQQEISKLQGLVEGEERERKRWAEELHDGVSGDLAAIKINIENLKNSAKTNENQAVFTDISETIDKSCVAIRELSHNLSPSNIIKFGLKYAITDYCEKVGHLHNIPMTVLFNGELPKLPKTIETHIYRIVQELTNNIVKHAKATTGTVELSSKEDTLTISVKDNGKGFSLNDDGNGIGLSNIDSRARFLNATMQVSSSKNGSAYIIYLKYSSLPKL